MESKILQIRFRTVNRKTFEAIRGGSKKIETRAGTTKYQKMRKGDRLTLVCGKSRITKRIKSAEHFKSIAALLKKYKVSEINPLYKMPGELKQMYYSFPGYKEKIKKYGLVAWELK